MTTRLTASMFAVLLLLGPCSLFAEDEQPWDEFGVAMSADQHATADGDAHFGRGVGSLQLTPPPFEASGESLVMDLNGEWRILPNPPKPQLERPWDDDWSAWDRIAVPSDYEMEGHAVARAVYVRSVAVPEAWRGRRVKLRFDEVASAATVWVNGQLVGRHVGHFIPFEFDVTDAVVFGGENVVTVLAEKESIARKVSGYALHVGGGITRGVRMFSVPSAHVAVMHAATRFDDAYKNATLDIDLRIVNEGRTPVGASRIEIALTDADGKSIACTPSRIDVPAIEAGKALARRVSVAVPAPEHWTAETPNLYDLTVTLETSDGKPSRVRRRIGFRELEVRGGELLVNGRPVKLRGSNRHLADPLRGRSITPEMARRDAELFKAANCNFIRTSHYPPSEEFIEACDELGLYVEEEAPFCFFNRPQMTNLADDDVTRYVTYANLKMVERDRSHPSVVLWSIANESIWGPHFEAAAKAVKRADPTRPTTFMWYQDSFGGLFDISAGHYPGPDGVTRADGRKPKIFSEYCHLPAYAPLEMYTDPGVEDRWGEVLRPTWNNLYATDGALGGAIWCGVDDVFHVPAPDGIKVHGVAPWGIIDGWRRPKPSYWHTLKTYSPFQVAKKQLDMPEPSEPLRIDVENRYDFANLDTLEVKWSLAGRQGIARVDAPARGKGVLEIPAGSTKAGDVLELTVTDRDGRLVDAYALPIGEAPSTADSVVAERWRPEETPDAFTVVRGDVKACIDKATGLLSRVVVDGEPVLIDGPRFQFAPTFTRSQQRAMKHAPPALVPGYGSNWKLEDLGASTGDGVVEILWKGRCDEAELEGAYRFLPSGELETPFTVRLLPDALKEGDLVWSKETGQRGFSHWKDADTAVTTNANRGGDEQEIPRDKLYAVPRQLGLEFTLPTALSNLEWEREGMWTVYPSDHIGRLKGRASAALDRDTAEALRVEPSWTWAEAGGELGTRDFRSTKQGLQRAALTALSGRGLAVLSDGRLSARAFTLPDGVHWLLITRDGAPSEGFMDGYFGPRRTRLPLDEPIEDTIRIRFLSGDQ